MDAIYNQTIKLRSTAFAFHALIRDTWTVTVNINVWQQKTNWGGQMMCGYFSGICGIYTLIDFWWNYSNFLHFAFKFSAL